MAVRVASGFLRDNAAFGGGVGAGSGWRHGAVFFLNGNDRP